MFCVVTRQASQIFSVSWRFVTLRDYSGFVGGAQEHRTNAKKRFAEERCWIWVSMLVLVLVLLLYVAAFGPGLTGMIQGWAPVSDRVCRGN